jgi:hypothetical protein
MLQGLVRGLTHRKRQGGEFEIIMENPVGSLSKQDCIKDEAWQEWTVQRKVDYCAYGRLYRKATHIWTTLKNWRPKGITGNGRCGWKCGQLSEQGKHGSEQGKETAVRMTRKHKQAIGAEACRLPRGPQQLQKIWSIPEMLQEELLEAIPEKEPGVKYVVDLFSGGESWRRQVEAQGYVYIGVDLRRSVRTEEEERERRDHSKRGGGVVVEGTSSMDDF